MARTFSTEFRSNLAAISADAPLYLLELNHEALTQPIRVASDSNGADADFVVSNSHTFIVFPFRIYLPDEQENQSPRASIEIAKDNGVMIWLEKSGGGSGSTVTIMLANRTNPDFIEWSTIMDLTNIHGNMQYITGDLTYDDIWNMSGMPTTYRPDITPGVF